MRILITGAGGVLGNGLAGAFGEDEVIIAGRKPAPAFPAAEFRPLDLLQPEELTRVISIVRPEVVLHAAAISRVEECERDPRSAALVNASSAREAALGAAEAGAILVYVSTDQVFHGGADRFMEDDTPSPLHNYGRTKAEGEGWVLQAEGAVARLPLLLGPPRGADAALLAALRSGQRPYLFTDELRTPLSASLAAAGLRELAQHKRSGVFHLAGSEAASRAGLGHRICAAAGIEAAFEEGPTPEEIAASRPRRLVLDCSRAERELGWQAPDLRQSLARLAPDADS